jgi:hypothetical protein
VGIHAADPKHFLGRYATRQSQFEVTRDSEGRLWLTSEPRNERLTMTRRAGIGTVVDRQEIRPLEQDTFVLIRDEGQTTGTSSLARPFSSPCSATALLSKLSAAEGKRGRRSGPDE